MTRGSNGLSPGTKYKRAKIASAVTSVALSLEYQGKRLLGLAAQSLIGSSGTLTGTVCVLGVTSDVVKVKGEDPATPGPLIE